MKTVGLSKFGMNSTKFYSILLNRIGIPEDIVVENIRFDYPYDYILLDGGSDVSPEFYEENNIYSYNNIFRDTFEKVIYNEYKNTNTKFVGICRGLQLLNVLRGGTLYQDLFSEKLAHKSSHLIYLDTTVESDLNKFLPSITEVNSLHHQAIKTLGKDLIPLAYEKDTNIIEIVGEEKDKIRAVQFHPEFINGFEYTREILMWLFRFI